MNEDQEYAERWKWRNWFAWRPIYLEIGKYKGWNWLVWMQRSGDSRFYNYRRIDRKKSSPARK